MVSPESHMIIRVKHDSDLVRYITELAKKEGITAASFTAIGALKRAKLGYYDQRKHEYSTIAIRTPHEIASCIGNISFKDGQPFVHAHAVLADEEGNTKAGHLFEGIVFASEVHLSILKDVKLERKYDGETKLSLWSIE